MQPPAARPTRLIHFSDIHLPVRRFGWEWRDAFSKRVYGWMNVRLLGRGHRFRRAAEVLEVLRRDIRERQYDHVVFSGDASALAFDEEFRGVVDGLGLTEDDWPAGITTPGNHDAYLPNVVAGGAFERHFAPWLAGERQDPDLVYPFAQKCGGGWLIGANSAQATFWMFDARGRVGEAQRDRLLTLLKRLEGRPKILVTHYPLVMPSGRPEPPFHRLIDYREMIDVCRAGGVDVWLCGHRHTGYAFEATDDIPTHVLCAGSVTQVGRWSYNEYDIAGGELHINTRTYDGDARVFRDRRRQTLPLRAG